MPSLTVSALTGAPSCADASLSSASRASAAACRRPPVRAYWVRLDWLPAVKPWSGVRHVSDSMTFRRASDTSSSSDTSCMVVVITPVPSSTLPVWMTTVPSPLMASHESICFGSTSAGPIFWLSICANARCGCSRRGSVALTTIAPVPARNVRRLTMAAISGLRLGRGLDRLDDPEVRPAPAQVRVHGLLDLVLGGARIALEERVRGHDHAVGAVAALRGLVLDERRLHLARLLGGPEALERRDLLALHRARRRDARADRLAVRLHGACAALREAAAEARAVQPQLVAQHVQQRRVRGRLYPMPPSIDADDQPSHQTPSWTLGTDRLTGTFAYRTGQVQIGDHRPGLRGTREGGRGGWGAVPSGVDYASPRSPGSSARIV